MVSCGATRGSLPTNCPAQRDPCGEPITHVVGSDARKVPVSPFTPVVAAVVPVATESYTYYGNTYYGDTYHGDTYCGYTHFGDIYYGDTYYGDTHYGDTYLLWRYSLWRYSLWLYSLWRYLLAILTGGYMLHVLLMRM